MTASTTPQTPRIGDLLIERNLITRSQLADAMQEQKGSDKRLGEILINRHLITEGQLRRSLKWQTFVRRAAMVSAFALAPLQFAHANNTDQLDHDSGQYYNYAAPEVHTELHYNDIYSDNGVALPSIGSEHTATTAEFDVTDALDKRFSSPVWTLLKGKYEGGVDSHTEGMRYKAKWSKKGIRLEVKYQF